MSNKKVTIELGIEDHNDLKNLAEKESRSIKKQAKVIILERLNQEEQEKEN